MKDKKVSVHVLQAVAVKGKHYSRDEKKAVSLPEADAQALIVRGKAKLVKAEKPATTTEA